VADPRGGQGPETINVPNWASESHRVTVQFRDFHIIRPIRPDPPVDVVATSGPLQATVSWSPPADDGGTPVFAYQVHDEDLTLLATTAGDVTTVDIIGLTEGDSVQFRVTAVASGVSVASEPTAPVTVLGPPAAFGDVGVGHPFGPEIMWAAARGLADGFDDGTLGTTRPVTRQAAAAFLHRLAGAPEGPFPAPAFSDVGPDHRFATEIAWMADAGLADGFDDGTFRPTRPVTRQAAAAFLYRLAGEPEVEWPPSSEPIPVWPPLGVSAPAASASVDVGGSGGQVRVGNPIYPDVPHEHPFVVEIVWLSTNAIATGYADGTFRPSADVTRQAMVAFMYRTTLRVPLLD
jgi:hypothetical protein